MPPPKLVVAPDAGRGLGVFAAIDLPAGAALLTEAPLAAAAGAGRCAVCLATLTPRARARAPCAGCGTVRYCDGDCEGADRFAHAGGGECALFAAGGAVLPAARDAALGLRLLAARPPAHGPLEAHVEDVMADADLAQAAAAAATALGAAAAARGVQPPPSPQLLATAARESVASAAINAVAWGEEGGSAAVYAFASRFNHSCRPTASYSPRPGGRIALRALLDIPAGSPVTVAYVDAGWAPRSARRAALAARYRFDCSCARCAEEPPSDAWLEAAAEGASAAAAGAAVAALARAAAAAAAGGLPPGDALASLLAALRLASTTLHPLHASILDACLLVPPAAAAAATGAASPRDRSALAATAALATLLPAAAGDSLLARGETCAVLPGGRAWAVAARALAGAAAVVAGGDPPAPGGAIGASINVLLATLPPASDAAAAFGSLHGLFPTAAASSPPLSLPPVAAAAAVAAGAGADLLARALGAAHPETERAAFAPAAPLACGGALPFAATADVLRAVAAARGGP